MLEVAVHKMHETSADVPWFRVIWATGERLLDSRADFSFHNERFIEASPRARRCASPGRLTSGGSTGDGIV